ncbi:MAG: lytic transglycosylase domain-containing protein, partial [Pseudomonadota bacterium]
HYQFDHKAIALLDHIDPKSNHCDPLLGWWSGLAAWRQGHYQQAATSFEIGLESTKSQDHDWQNAQLHFWSSRAYLRAREVQKANIHLNKSADFARTFYGLIANKILGYKIQYNWQFLSYKDYIHDALIKAPWIRRAIALIEIGQYERANKTLKHVANKLSLDSKIWMIRFAEEVGLADLAYDLGRQIAQQSGQWADYALFPLPNWTKNIEFHLPPALILGIIRKESAFRIRATSRAGASGLMQLMPATAGFMAGQSFRNRSARIKLFNPEFNIKLGQDYLIHLLNHQAIQNNLIKALASYNAGPGNLIKWNQSVAHLDDPLLLIESLKALETRKYVKYVLTNSWVYSQRLGSEDTSLKELASGRWPKINAAN